MSEKINESTGEVVIATPVVAIEKYDPDDPVQLYMSPSIFGQLQRLGKMMSNTTLVPAHFQGKESDCAMIAAQAFRWRMDPFAVAASAYVLQGKLGYEGKLVAAVINASNKLAKTLNYEYKGDGADRVVRVFGTLKGEDKPREIIGELRKWKTNNKQWSDNPDQMLSYRGAREWARRHMPEAILGVQSIDEVEVIAEEEAKKVLPEVLEGILASAEVKGTDDPPERGAKKVSDAIHEVVVETIVIPPKENPKKAKRDDGSELISDEAAHEFLTGEKNKAKEVFEVGQVLPNGKVVEEVDDYGQIVIVGKPKPKPKPDVPMVTMSDPAPEKMSKEDEDLDGLFS